MDGIICIHKAEGWTSFDVVAKARGIAKTKKVGHAGTLDPMATGVLPLFFGAATKLCDMLPNEKKGYLAEFQLGCTTDTLDRTGTVLSECAFEVTEEQILAVLPTFMGDILQVPPMYSAVQVDGKRLYDLARQGKQVERKARPVCIERLELQDFCEETGRGHLLVECSKGTYIRTLVDDIGQALGVGATLWELQRFLAGRFTLEDCYTLTQLQELVAGEGLESLESIVRPIDSVLQDFPAINLNEVQSGLFCNGVKLDLARVRHSKTDGNYRVYDHDSHFLGLARADEEKGQLRLVKSFWQAAKG